MREYLAVFIVVAYYILAYGSIAMVLAQTDTNTTTTNFTVTIPPFPTVYTIGNATLKINLEAGGDLVLTYTCTYTNTTAECPAMNVSLIGIYENGTNVSLAFFTFKPQMTLLGIYQSIERVNVAGYSYVVVEIKAYYEEGGVETVTLTITLPPSTALVLPEWFIDLILIMFIAGMMMRGNLRVAGMSMIVAGILASMVFPLIGLSAGMFSGIVGAILVIFGLLFLLVFTR